MKKFVFVLLLMLATTVQANNYVYLKSGGEFRNYSKISTDQDFDRMVNLDNVSTLRKVEDCKLLIDNNLVILFSNKVERDNFISENFTVKVPQRVEKREYSIEYKIFMLFGGILSVLFAYFWLKGEYSKCH